MPFSPTRPTSPPSMQPLLRRDLSPVVTTTSMASMRAAVRTHLSAALVRMTTLPLLTPHMLQQQHATMDTTADADRGEIVTERVVHMSHVEAIGHAQSIERTTYDAIVSVRPLACPALSS